ncbi:MAG: TraB/GumN family protein [Chitinophagaceae bacterium]|nr:TraB/GumN family protein [Chitinophagaceae bacterium]
MKRTFILFLLISPFLLQAQPKIKNKKYPSLLWEITGKGLKKPSYLFGTMHVSNKLAFQLADSFYMGIKNADVVALETNPESWQEDMSKYQEEEGSDGYNNFRYRPGSYMSMPNDYLSINTLKFYKYDKKIERSLYSNPSTINNLLYRTYGNSASDFEEDTYLDMYIYQCGKKWGKKVAGVEKYGESMKLMAEAYKDAAKDKKRKERSYDREEGFSADKLQEAYRTGNLDLLDSINKYNSFSEAFDEKFLYKRNEIQANSIDSILKSKMSLFVGVGAAHLPGNRGVIEMLRAMGYKLRPVKMGERDSQHKNSVEKIRVPVVFATQAADDGFFKVDIPGKFYKFGDDGSLDQRQYADMANGSYYMVTRIMTNGWMWGHTTEEVYKKVDSLLYENVPGKIISKKAVTKNGYKGFDITNKTRRGDMQRYQIFVTPFEIIFFKMSGTGDYVKNGDEANKFFNSIQLKEYKNGTEWKKYSPAYGGFSIDFPHEPYIGNDGSWIYDSEDKAANTQYRVMRSDIHNYSFVEEDTFDLGLMQESFASSEFIDTVISRKHIKHKGYPALDCKFLDKNRSVYLARFIIQGPHYYTLVVKGKQEIPKMQAFFNSFEIKPFVYGEAKERKDTSLYFTVKSPVFPDENKDKIDIPRYNLYGYGDDDEESEDDILEGGTFRNKTISNDTTGEKVYVSFYKSQRYYTATDSSILNDDNDGSLYGDTTLIVRMKKKFELPNKMKVWERIVSDTGSSRAIWTKTFYKDGIGFSLVTQIDTLTKPGSFVQSFYDSFVPADTLKGSDPFAKKTALFFEDFMSKDTVVHKRAVKNIYTVKMDSTDLIPLQKAISSLNWNEKRYLDTKKSLIGKLDDMPSKAATDYLRDLYYAAGDTVELQYTILQSLLGQQTQYAFHVFRDIITIEPPVLNVPSDNNYNDYSYTIQNYRRGSSYGYGGNFMSGLYDSLKLARTILPDLLPLMNLDDYEQSIMQLLGQMVDSGLVKPADYQPYFSKFLIEAKQELKKQAIAEKNKAIKKAEEDKEEKNNIYRNNDEKDNGNDGLELYATLLLPWLESNPAVKPLMQQMLASNDKQLKYKTMMLMLRNNKPVPDTLPLYFAGLDEYRYDLFKDLKELKKSDKFPAKYNNHLDLGKGKLLDEKSYDKPDSVAYVDRVPAEIKGKKGFVYFYKYKSKKDDLTWKLATVGLVPEDPKAFEFENVQKPDFDDYYSPMIPRSNEYYALDLTGFSDTKIKEDEPLNQQLTLALKKMLYAKRKSAAQFYEKEGRGDYDINTRIDFGD